MLPFDPTIVIIKYDPMFGEPVSDGAIPEVMERLFETNSVTCWSTSNIFIAVRLFIAERGYNGDDWHNHIFFEFNGKRFQANEYGAINPWPLGFCDQDSEMATKLAMAAMRKRNYKLKNKEIRP